jgi:hypothetical protein
VVKVFCTYAKLTEGFAFLASVEGRVYIDSLAYRSGVAKLIDLAITLPREAIEQKFLSTILTERQEREVSTYLESSEKGDLQIVRDFWSRRSVKAVGLAVRMNWEEKTNQAHVKEIRQEAVQFYTGIGTAASEDGIFSKEQKWAANAASGLTQVDLDLHRKYQNL